MSLLPIDQTHPTQCSNRRVCTKESLLDEPRLRAFRGPSGLAADRTERPGHPSRCRTNASIELLREPMARTRAVIAQRTSALFWRAPVHGVNAREPPD